MALKILMDFLRYRERLRCGKANNNYLADSYKGRKTYQLGCVEWFIRD